MKDRTANTLEILSTDELLLNEPCHEFGLGRFDTLQLREEERAIRERRKVKRMRAHHMH